MGPANIFFEGLQALSPQRRPVGLAGTGDCRRAVTDRGAAGDHGWLAGLGLRQFNGGQDGFLIVSVDGLHVPACGFEALALVFAGRQVGFAVDGDLVVVPEYDELTQLEVTGEGNRLLAHALHQATVACNHIGEVVDQLVTAAGGEPLLRHRKADRVCDTLTQRTGGGLNAFGVAVFRVPRGFGAELAEVADFLDRNVFIACEVER